MRALQKGKPFIAVAINYRLNIFGFGASSDMIVEQSNDEVSPIRGVNFGLRDQKLGLLWVKRDIAAFGGDSDTITIMGDSAGAISCHIHVLELEQQETTSLFQKAISISGA